MGDRQVSQPEAERSGYQSQDSSRALFTWGPEERATGNQTCKQVGNTLVCGGDIYGTAKPSETFRAIIALQQDMGLISQTQAMRVADNQPQPYFPPGVPVRPGVGPQVPSDQYSFNQGDRRPGQPGTVGQSGQVPLDPFSFHQGDKAPVVQPPRPGNVDVPMPPRPGVDVPMPPLPSPIENPRPPVPQPVPRTDCQPQPQPYQPSYPCQPCQPCRPHHGGWYPGKIAGRVMGRIFGGRCR